MGTAPLGTLIQTGLGAKTKIRVGLGCFTTLRPRLTGNVRRSGSMRTMRAYSGMLCRFFITPGQPLDQVTAPEVFSYAHGTGLSGKKPSSVTIGARIACLSSFYRFLIPLGLVSGNPWDQLERPRATPTQNIKLSETRLMSACD